MRPLRHSFSAILLALAVLLGQHAVALHALGHASDELRQQDSKQAPKSCEQHSLFASLASGVGCAPIVAAHVSAVLPADTSAPRTPVALSPRYSFHSRAPPATPA